MFSLSFHRIGLGALPPSSDPKVTKVRSCVGKVSSFVGAHHFMGTEEPFVKLSVRKALNHLRFSEKAVTSNFRYLRNFISVVLGWTKMSFGFGCHFRNTNLKVFDFGAFRTSHIFH